MGKIRITNNPSLSVIISILGGVFVIVGSLSLLAMFSWYGSTLVMGGPLHMYTLVYPYWLTIIMASISVSAGGLILWASYKMYKEPKNKLWAFLIIIGSLAGLLTIGGFGLGGGLGLIGGIIGLSRRR